MFRSICRAKPRLPQQTPSGPIRSFRTSHFSTNKPFEEETLPCYIPRQFYPVRVGELFDSTYKVLGKLGYGLNSTVWLCRNIRDKDLVAVKVCAINAAQSASIHRELKFYEHVSSLGSQHTGQAFVRGLLGTFEITGPSGQHLCLVHPPMHTTIRELQYTNSSHKLNEPLLKWVISNILEALSFLHDEAKVVHADINASNIMLTVADPSVLEAVEQAESQNLLPRKVIDDSRTIYSSHVLGLPKDSLWGQPVLCDFGEARIGQRHEGLVQPELYRAPEVLFDMEWDSSIDIWSIATLIWDLLENKHLFNALDEDGETSATDHVAEMVAYMGLPPLEFLKRSEDTRNVFDDEGRWTSAGGTAIPSITLEDSLSALDGDSKRLLLSFVRSMLRWEPEQRKAASDLLKDPWLAVIRP